MNRRQMMTAGAALAAMPLLPATALAGAASREFRILRGGSDIGRHRLDARLDGGVFEIGIAIDIAVRVLGLTAYRYTLENTERWQDGLLVSASSRANDDGDRARLSISRGAQALEVDGSGFSGTAPLEAVTTSYFARPMIDRRPWLSSQSGAPLDISVSSTGGGRWQIAGELETLLTYDGAGEWIGCEFDGKGERVTYEITGGSGDIAALWSSA